MPYSAVACTLKVTVDITHLQKQFIHRERQMPLRYDRIVSFISLGYVGVEGKMAEMKDLRDG
jgi:hypothetical protein